MEIIDLTKSFRQTNLVNAGKKWVDGERVARFGKKPEPLAARLERMTDRSGGEDSCWEFTGARNKSGYGWMHVGSQADGSRTRMLAHRVAVLLSGVDIPDGMFVLHTCNNPPCCNPKHLTLGDHAENMRQMVSAGRQEKSDRHHAARLTSEQVKEIRERFTSENHKALGLEYGVHPTYIHMIVRGAARKYD